MWASGPQGGPPRQTLHVETSERATTGRYSDGSHGLAVQLTQINPAGSKDAEVVPNRRSTGGASRSDDRVARFSLTPTEELCYGPKGMDK